MMAHIGLIKPLATILKQCIVEFLPVAGTDIVTKFMYYDRVQTVLSVQDN